MRWAGGIAAALALAIGALLWAAAPRAEPDEPAAPLDAAVTMSTPLDSPTPEPLPESRPSLPTREAALDPVQSITPPPVAEITAALTGRASAKPVTPTAFASLDLTLLQPCGLPGAGVKLRVRAPRSTWIYREVPPTTDGSGHVLIAGLPADTPLWLDGSDALSFEALARVELWLAPDEHRVLTETLTRDLRTVEVKVRDRSGQSIDGAAVTLVAAHTQGSERTLQTVKKPSLQSGQAHFPCLAAESVSVSAQLDGFAPAWLADTPLDRDPLLLELVLDPGFPVEVEVVDEAGRARDVDAVQVRGSPVTMLAERTAPGRYRFAAFPEAAHGITASVQGQSWHVEHVARSPLARIVVPAPGALAVTWEQLVPGCEPKGIFIYSEPPGWGWFESVDDATRASRGPVLFEDLAPGEYRIELHCPGARPGSRSARVWVSSNARTDLRLEP